MDQSDSRLKIPKPYTKRETRDKLASKMADIAQYWLAESRSPGLMDKIEGVGHSVGATLDGCTLDVCGQALAPRSAVGGVHGIEEGLGLAVAQAAKKPGLLAQARSFAALPEGVDGVQPDDPEDSSPDEDRMLARWRVASWRWTKLAAAGGCSQEEAVLGFAISVGCVFEGEPGWDGIVMMPMPSSEDKDYHILRGERYFEPLAEDDPVRGEDLGGTVKTQWVQRWANDGAPAAGLRAHLTAIEERQRLEAHSAPGRPAKSQRM